LLHEHRDGSESDGAIKKNNNGPQSTGLIQSVILVAASTVTLKQQKEGCRSDLQVMLRTTAGLLMLAQLFGESAGIRARAISRFAPASHPCWLHLQRTIQALQ